MFPGMGGMNPQQMAKMMRQMGINSEELKAKRVVIETAEGKIVVEPAQVTAITMQGQKTYQVIGKERVERGGKESEDEKAEGAEENEGEDEPEDFEVVMDQTGCSQKEAEKALEEMDGDIAEAIMLIEKRKREEE